MNDTISRKAAIEAVRKCSVKEVTPAYMLINKAEAMTELMLLPSAEPEIIRCKDCKHRYIEDMIWHCPFSLMGGENFFCGYGSLGIVERRTDE